MPDEITKAPHYNNSEAECKGCGRPIECIDVVRHMTFNLGNTIKYIWRKDYKDDPIKDLLKARYYIDDEIRRLEHIADRKK